MPPRKSHRKSSKRSTPSARRSKSPRPPRRALLAAPYVGPAFQKLVAVMARLRAPNGCPWDREQTHATLRTYLIEEAYEVLDALDSTDDAKFAEELGDLLLQVLFHAQIANEEGRFNISDVIREIYEKMIRRHPHVFGEKRAKDAAEVLRNWELIKAEERRQKEAKEAKQGKKTKEVQLKEKEEVKQAKAGAIIVPTSGRASSSSLAVGQGESSSPAAASSTSFISSSESGLRAESKRTGDRSFRSDTDARGGTGRPELPPGTQGLPEEPESLLDGVPRSLPALLEAFQLTRKAARIGFDWDSIDGIFDKLDEETHELRHVLAQPEPRNLQASTPVAAGLQTRKSTLQGESPSPAASSIESELGDILFVAVNLARFLNVDPEIALKKTSAKFSRRFREMERLAREQGTTLAQVPRPQMESLWDQAKLRERSNP